MTILDRIKLILAIVFMGPSVFYGMSIFMGLMKFQLITTLQLESPMLNSLFSSDFHGIQVFIGLAGISGVILLNSIKTK